MSEPARKGRGGPRPNSGGARPGAGRPKGSSSTVRRVSISLDQELSNLLATVEADGMDAPDAVRWCIRHAVEHVEAHAEELAAGSAPKIPRAKRATSPAGGR